MALQLRPKCRTITNPSLIHLSFFSTSSTPDPSDPSPENPTNASSQSPESSISSYFSDVKASLKHQQTSPRKPTSASPSFSTPSAPRPSKGASLDEIRRNLSEFRLRTAAPPPTGPTSAPSSSSSQQPISFLELYKKNVIDKGDGVNTQFGQAGGKMSFDPIRESLRKFRQSGKEAAQAEKKGPEPMSMSPKEGFKFGMGETNVDSKIIGGTEALPVSVFGKEMTNESKGGDDRSAAMRTEFVKMYDYKELGEKLRILRPDEEEVAGEKGGGGGFSLRELNERLMK